MLKIFKEPPSKLEKGYSQVLVKQTVGPSLLDSNNYNVTRLFLNILFILSSSLVFPVHVEHVKRKLIMSSRSLPAATTYIRAFDRNRRSRPWRSRTVIRGLGPRAAISPGDLSRSAPASPSHFSPSSIRAHLQQSAERPCVDISPGDLGRPESRLSIHVYI